jgi:hypothetical protein
VFGAHTDEFESILNYIFLVHQVPSSHL